MIHRHPALPNQPQHHVRHLGVKLAALVGLQLADDGIRGQLFAVDPVLVSIPVIVLTADQGAELDCLRIGAMDFIPKPFPNIEIVKARIAKCIEFSESRDLIRHTQRDKLTGVPTRSRQNIMNLFAYIERNPIIETVKTAAALCLPRNGTANYIATLWSKDILKYDAKTGKALVFASEEYLDILRKDT